MEGLGRGLCSGDSSSRDCYAGLLLFGGWLDISALCLLHDTTLRLLDNGDDDDHDDDGQWTNMITSNLARMTQS